LHYPQKSNGVTSCVALPVPTTTVARAGTTPQKTARKCQVILLASQGMSNYSIAQRTGLSRPTILAARVAFTERGINCIRQSKKRKRSRRVLTPEVEQRILDTTLKTRPANATHWSVRVTGRKVGGVAHDGYSASGSVTTSNPTVSRSSRFPRIRSLKTRYGTSLACLSTRQTGL
jgi:transposase